MNPLLSRFLTPALALTLALVANAFAQDNRIDIEKWADGSRLIPLSISGFNGEVDDVLRFDLEVAGCKIVAADEAQYLVSGRNAETVEGTLTDRVSKAVLLNTRYERASLRAQAHAFADDIVKRLTGVEGITRKRIAFKVDTGRTSEIYVADYDGFNAAPVTQDGSIVAAPAWVPGKRVLYYTSYMMNNPDVFSHDLQTRARTPIARYSGLNTSASISPDGRRVALILSKSGSPDVFVCDADGSNLKQLTKTREDESSPCWSPDGRQICFASRTSGRAALYTVPVDGGEMRRIRTDGAINTTEPDWSPDGKLIVFTAQMGGFQICTVPAAGGTANVLGVAGEDPSWAANSRTVVFTRRTNGKRTLSLLDVPTKRVKDVRRLSVPGNCSQPAWAR